MSQILALLPEARTASRASAPAPTTQLAATSFSEKQQQLPSSYYQPALPPPVYGTAVASVLAMAHALYAYHPSDAGDLAFSPADRIAIHEFMNADWAKGRNERTGLEGIFPRSYVQVVDEASVHSPLVPVQMPQQQVQQHGGISAFGGMPMMVSEGGGGGGLTTGNAKIDSNGKKFGKKLGNAAIFGAGATIGSSIVGSIL